jgi:predicted amidohydrolase
MTKKLKIALAQLNPLVGDVTGNVNKLITIRSKLDSDVDLLVAPELYVSGYPIDDIVKGERVRIKGYLEDFALSKNEADELIMSARNIIYKD